MPADVDFIVPGGAFAGPLFARLVGETDGRVLAAGTRVGAFRIVDLIGQGGAGFVYRARRDDGTFEQDVALKLVRSDARLKEAMRRERNMLGQLEHPGIARIFDGGETDAGELWYAMELVRGERIDRWCETHHADWRARVRLVEAVCDAVAYAHARLVIHRDIKPSNILVDEHGAPKLLDFGIARDVREPTGDNEPIAFTPGFASPEQIGGAPAATSSDIYQLGHLLAILLESAPPPRGLAQRNLAGVLAKAQQVEPTARYPDASTLRADLERAATGKPARASHLSLPIRAAMLVRRHVALASAVALATLVLIGASVQHTIALSHSRGIAEAQARHASIANEVLANLFRTADSGGAATDAAALNRGVHAALQRFETGSEARAVASETLAKVYLDLAMPDRADALAAAALAEYGDERSNPRERVHLLLLRARASFDSHHSAAGHAALDAAAPLVAALDEDAPERHRLEALRVTQTEQEGDADGAHARRDALIASLSEADAADAALLSELLLDRSSQRVRANNYDGAKADATRALALTRARFGALSAQSLAVERALSWIAVGRGDLDDAAARLDAQRATALGTFGPASAEYADVLTAEAIVLNERADYTAADAKFAEAYGILRRRFGNDATPVAPAAHNLADTRMQLGQPAQALELYRDALRIRLLTLDDGNQTVVVNRLQIARAQCALGQYADADAGFAAARAQLAKLHPPGHPYLATAAAMNVDCLLKRGRIADARRMFDEAGLQAAANDHGSGSLRVRNTQEALLAAETDARAGATRRR